MSRWLPLISLTLVAAVGCKKVPYVVFLEGEWTGTANDATGAALPMTADFSFDDDEEYFYGTVDLNGYVFNVDGVTSDKKSADITLISPLQIGDLALGAVSAEEDEMKGDFTLNLTVPAPATQTGSFTLELQ